MNTSRYHTGSKIVGIEVHTEHLPLTRPYTIAYETVDAVENVFVRLRTEDGLVGHGVAAPSEHVTGETDAASRAALDQDALQWLVGGDVRRLGALCEELRRRMSAQPAARAAVDTALHDLFAQRLGAPLVDVLGRVHESLPTSITVGIKSVAETVEEAREYVGRGFRTLKIKLGHSLAEDIERLVKLREQWPSGVVIRVDANQGYGLEDVHRFFRETGALDLEFVEQPMPVSVSMRDLDPAEREKIAADESLLSDADALALAESPRACGIFNIKLMKCGGIRPALRIASIAQAAGITLMWGCMDESRIGIAAALHAALASPATRYLDLDGSLDLASDVVEGGFILEDGCMRTSDAPGLGVTPV